MERKTALFSEFGAGQFSSFEDEKIPQNAARTAQNCIIESDGTIVKRDIQSFIERVGSDTGTIVNHCKYLKTTGEIYDIVATSLGKVFYRLQGTAATYTEITGFATGFGITNDINMLSYSDVLWLVDGVSGYTWDGTTLTLRSSGASAYWEAAYNDPKYIEASQGVIYLAGISDDSAAIYHSVYWDSTGTYLNPTSADAWDSTQIVKLPVAGEKITALKNYHDKLFITTAKRIFIISGYVSQINPQLVEIYSEDGCIDNKTFREINGILYWVGQRGVYKFDGSSISLISEGIKNYFEWLRSSTNNRLLLNYDSQTAYNTFRVFTNCDKTSVPNSIVSASYPKHDKIMTAQNINGRGGNVGVGQDIIFDEALSGSLTVRFYYSSSKAQTCTVKLTKDGEGSATYTTTCSLTSTGSARTLGLATFTGTDIDPDSSWFISFEISDNSENLNIWTTINSLLGISDTIRTKATTASAWVDLSGQGANEILDIIVMPSTCSIRTDTSLLNTLLSTQRFSTATDEIYCDETDTSWTFQYRTGATEAACLAASWTTLSGNDVNISLTNSPASNTYIQFQISALNDMTDLSDKYSSIKIDGISLTYIIGTAVTNRLFGFTHLGRYYIAIPREGYPYNDRVFVLNYNSGWTYFDLMTHCIWEQDGLITFGRSDTNEVYQLSEVDSQITDQWNSQTDWQSESEDSNCDDTTTAGSLQAEATVTDYSDSFAGTDISTDWTTAPFTSNLSQNDGLTFTLSYPTIDDLAYISKTVSIEGATTIIQKIDVANYNSATTKTGTSTNGCGFWLQSDNGWIAILYDAYTSGFVKCATGVSITSYSSLSDDFTLQQYVWLKSVVTKGSPNDSIAFSYSLDGTNYTAIDTKTLATGTYTKLWIASARNINDNDTSTVIFESLSVSTINEYTDGSYRIYKYASNGDAKIYWEGTNASSTNTITIYYASRHSTSVPDDATIDETYDWELLGTITDDAPTGDTTFTTNGYKYIKVVFNETDTSYSPLIDRLYMITDEDVEMIWETGMMEYGSPDNEKYIRKVYVDSETEAGMSFYYKTEKMTDYRKVELTSSEKRTSLPVEHGKKVQWKLISDNALTCSVKHLQLEYKEHKLR